MISTRYTSLVSFIVALTVVQAAEWSYEGSNGPSYWYQNSPLCAESSQSPIDLSATDAEIDDTLGDFSFSGYTDTSDTWTLHNNGHTLQVGMMTDVQRTVSGGGLPGTYIAAQFHMHWGDGGDEGSEHYINGESYPMELHIVHFSDKYGNLSHAAMSEEYDALAVLGIMFEISDTESPMMAAILDGLDDVKYARTETNMAARSLEEVLPSNTTWFARYNGSLTTPGCYEIVQWTVFREPLPVTAAQLMSLRSILYSESGEDEDPMINNYRPLQSRNGRLIKVSYAWGAGATLRPFTILSLTVALLAALFHVKF